MANLVARTLAKPGVLVVGAGPVGLALATLLAQNDVPVRIIDKARAHPTAQRGAGFQPRTLELYSIAGLDMFHKASIRVPPRRVYGPGGVVPKTTFDPLVSREPTPDTPFTAGTMLGQGRHTALLREALAQYGVAVETGTELTELAQDVDGVDVGLTKHGATEESAVERARFQWVVGTDGARSTVRKIVGIEFLGETHQDGMVYGDVLVEGLDADYMHVWGDIKSTTVVLRPTEDAGVFQLIVHGKNLGVDRAHLVANPDALIEYVHKIIERQDVRLVRVTASAVWTPNIRMASKFTEGRVFLAGDAAHIHSPTGGQGMNSGVQDAFNLAWKLAFVHKGRAPATLLASYDSERRPVIAQMLHMTTELLSKMVALNMDPSITRPAALLMLGINYRWSALVTPRLALADASPYYAPEGQLAAGDRAPQAPALRVVQNNTNTNGAGMETSVWKLLATDRFTALVFAGAGGVDVGGLFAGADAGAVRKVVVLPQGAAGAEGVEGADDVVVDEGGHAYKAYGVPVGEERTVVIRPDAYIGALVKDPSSVNLGVVFGQ